MRTYTISTGIFFALLVMVHIWRAIAESMDLTTQPAFIAVTLASAAISIWAFRLARHPNAR